MIKYIIVTINTLLILCIWKFIYNSSKNNNYNKINHHVMFLAFYIMLIYFINQYYINAHNHNILNRNLLNKKTQNINKFNAEMFDSRDDFGFIIIRHVNSEMTNNYWIECIKCIQKFYNNQIIIIDDNSNIKYLNNNNNIFTNCKFIKSKFNGRGELLPYYYFYHHKFFNKAIIIHDSLFFNKYINFDEIDDCKFIFHFESHIYDEDNKTISLIKQLTNSEFLIEKYMNKNEWKLCFGIQSVVTYDFLNNIQKKYNFLNLINFIKTRDDRMCLERIYGLLCTIENETLIKNSSILGRIDNHIRWGYRYNEYLEDKKNNNLEKYTLIKVWSGR